MLKHRMANQNYVVNEKIQEKTVLLIDDTGKSFGNQDIEFALDMASSKGLDLVLIAPNANPPVCKIMNFGKFKFEQSKKEKEKKKNSKSIETKEVQVSMRIDKHDLDTKIRNARKFLSQGYRVHVVMRLRGRENSLTDIGFDIMNTIVKECSDVGTVLKPAEHSGNQIILLLASISQEPHE